MESLYNKDKTEAEIDANLMLITGAFKCDYSKQINHMTEVKQMSLKMLHKGSALYSQVFIQQIKVPLHHWKQVEQRSFMSSGIVLKVCNSTGML